MKMILLLSLFVSTAHAAKLCAVSGITDSPQNLTCEFSDKLTVSLSCREGVYFVGEERVKYTWHEEVESGNTPLLFKTESSLLKITKQERGETYDAVLDGSSQTSGTCR